MAESKPDSQTNPLSESKVKTNSDISFHHQKETHGLRMDIDENTPIDEVRGPSVFERAKEELEAVVQAIHPKKESPTYEKGDQVEKPNLIKKAKEEIQTIMNHLKSPRNHYKETHGLHKDIDDKTPTSEVKAPNVFVRTKEEIEAVVQTIHPKKESDTSISSDEKDGCFFGARIARSLEKVCSPRSSKQD